VLDRAIYAAGALEEGGRIAIRRDRAAEARDAGDRSRPPDAGLHQPHLERAEILRCEAPELRIEVTAARRWRLSSPTTGKGIPDRQQSLIFEKFARLDTAKGAPGAGLGLAISREIMGRLGGSLTYQPGRAGTRFVVRLPLGCPGSVRHGGGPVGGRVETSLTRGVSQPAFPARFEPRFVHVRHPTAR
jgi:signal transduction histidine kinase